MGDGHGFEVLGEGKQEGEEEMKERKKGGGA